MKPSDFKQRATALNVEQSFIVQAPAGSGKTSLLTLRILKLLTVVERPEEILAITFTNKAAAEMRERVVDALLLAQSPPPKKVYEREQWDLATQVRQRDAEKQWHLMANISRLKVQTIDAFCSSLTRHLPVSSGFGFSLTIDEYPARLYQQAAEDCLTGMIEEGAEHRQAVSKMLASLDNHFGQAVDLLAGMLAQRDQWIRHVLNEDNVALQRSLEKVHQHTYQRLNADIDPSQKTQLQQLVQYALDQHENPEKLTGFYRSVSNDKEQEAQFWVVVSSIFLTDSGCLRKTVNKTNGFPAARDVNDPTEKAHRDQMKAQWADVKASIEQNTGFIEHLSSVKKLPALSYEQRQLDYIDALRLILKLAISHLRLLFKQNGQVDYCEVALSASLALGDEESPTDLALKYDYRLKHLLIDEFQDTSQTQYDLLRKLMMGWSKDDERTLFLVGDPMQSIYRFRQAEVGLFLNAQTQGIRRDLPINSLQLTTNFRSTQGIVNWVNQMFSDIMPDENDINVGAVQYHHSMASDDTEVPTDAVSFIDSLDPLEQAEKTCDVIEQIRAKSPKDSIAVLVRSRGHVKPLVACLIERNISFSDSDMNPLSSRPYISDLMALTRAFLSRTDRVAWLSVLRAPWCGLTLPTLTTLFENEPNQPVWERMQQLNACDFSAPSDHQRMLHVQSAFIEAFNRMERLSHAEIIKTLWRLLKGPLCWPNETQQAETQCFFDTLAEHEKKHRAINVLQFEQEVEKLYAQSDVIDSKLQIMTMHGAKGLEFDHVVLYDLNRQSKNNSPPLLSFLESAPDENGMSDLIIAPRDEKGLKQKSPTLEYIKWVEAKKEQYELQRLFYVAATRAKKQLFCTFQHKFNEKGQLKKPISGLLTLLWPTIGSNYEHLERNGRCEEDLLNEVTSKITIQRLPDTCFEQSNSPKLLNAGQHQQRTFFDDASCHLMHTARIGTVTHQCLQLMGESGVQAIDHPKFEHIKNAVSYLLREQGILDSQRQHDAQHVIKMLENTLADKRGQWLLNHEHQDSRFEWAITGEVSGEVKNVRVDRTFVDEGVRWIIDFKTGQAEDCENTFLQHGKSQYREQLETYAGLISSVERRPIKLALYYPAFVGWIDWCYEPTQ